MSVGPTFMPAAEGCVYIPAVEPAPEPASIPPGCAAESFQQIHSAPIKATAAHPTIAPIRLLMTTISLCFLPIWLSY